MSFASSSFWTSPLSKLPGAPRLARGTSTGANHEGAREISSNESSGVPSSRTTRHGVAFTLELGLALHRYGVPANRLEAALTRVSERFGLLGMFFSTPTALFASFRPAHSRNAAPDGQVDLSERQAFMIRAEPGESNLRKMTDVDQLVGQVIRGEVALRPARVRLGAIVHRRELYDEGAVLLAYTVASAMAAVMLGGGAMDILVSLVSGVFAGLVSRLNTKGARFSHLTAPVSAFSAALVGTVAARLGLPVSAQVCVISGLIVLVPGLTLTTALRELAAGHLVSGTSRLAAALVLFVQIGFGVALGVALAGVVPASTPQLAVPLPSWALWVSVVGMVPAFAVLFRSPSGDLGWILAAGVLAVGGAQLGAMLLGPTLGSFVGALALGLGSHALANLRDRPVSTTLVPGIMFLVPGSVGLRSVTFLLDQDIVTGVKTAFTMTMVGASLVAGLVLAAALLPARREL